MNTATIVERRTTPADHAGDGGAIPASLLHFRTGRSDEAAGLVLKHHYSRRVPSAVEFVGSLHLDGGLFGGDGPMVAAALFRTPSTRWAEPVLELTRLVRGDDRVPLTMLIARCCSVLRGLGYDLLISYADRTAGHEGYVYRASNWFYAGCRAATEDGVYVDDTFVPGRMCNNLFGTRSVAKLQQAYPHKTFAAHYDKGKHLYWYPLGRRGQAKAQRLGLVP